jgi:hypothetical protein
MKTKRLSIPIIILFCSVTLLVSATSASTQIIPGVSKNELFDYNYSINWTSTNPSATPPAELVDYNNTQQIQIKITSVSGSTVNWDFVRHFRNGSQTVETKSVNLQTGSVDVPFSFLIIGANLAKNERIYPDGGYQTITDTVTRSYSTGSRETNVLSSEDSSQKTSLYFDKIKGIAVEYIYTIYQYSDSGSIVSTERMVNTNSDVWATATSQASSSPSPSVPEFSLLVVPVVLAAASFALLLAKKTQKLPLKL